MCTIPVRLMTHAAVNRGLYSRPSPTLFKVCNWRSCLTTTTPVQFAGFKVELYDDSLFAGFKVELYDDSLKSDVGLLSQS